MFAEIGFGETYQISGTDQIAEAFGLALAGLQTTVATQIKITLTPVGGTSITQLLQSGNEIEAPAAGQSAECAPPLRLPLFVLICLYSIALLCV